MGRGGAGEVGRRAGPPRVGAGARRSAHALERATPTAGLSTEFPKPVPSGGYVGWDEAAGGNWTSCRRGFERPRRSSLLILRKGRGLGR